MAIIDISLPSTRVGQRWLWIGTQHEVPYSCNGNGCSNIDSYPRRAWNSPFRMEYMECQYHTYLENAMLTTG